MTQEEAWIKKMREFDRETGGPYVVPPWLKEAEEATMTLTYDQRNQLYALVAQFAKELNAPFFDIAIAARHEITVWIPLSIRERDEPRSITCKMSKF